jgi:uncharacterized protein YecT (DUF1311 family)
MRVSFWLVLILPLVGTTKSFAQTCNDAANQMQMNECAETAFKNADDELNSVYGNIVRRLKTDEVAKKLLVAAQKAWLRFRDAECVFISSASSGGSIYPVIVANCRTNITQERVNGLKRYLSCEEGYMSCPVPADK